MKKRIFSILLAGLLLLAATGCANDKEDYIARLEDENAQLRSQVEALTSQLQVLGENVGLVNWDLQVQAWNSGSGATVTFTGTPALYAQEQSATFTVWLEGEEVASVPCQWNGSVYTGVVDLDAADGYSYYCTLISSNGSKEQLPLNTPENPVYDNLVYLQTGLTAYCNLIVDGWEDEGGKLTITSGFVQAQLPRVGTEENPLFAGAQLLLRLNGEVVETQDLDLPEGEGEGSYEQVLSGVSFQMPAMEDDYQLEVALVVTLSDGQTITSSGGSWYYNGGEMLMVVG